MIAISPLSTARGTGFTPRDVKPRRTEEMQMSKMTLIKELVKKNVTSVCVCCVVVVVTE